MNKIVLAFAIVAMLTGCDNQEPEPEPEQASEYEQLFMISWDRQPTSVQNELCIRWYDNPQHFIIEWEASGGTNITGTQYRRSYLESAMEKVCE